MLGRLLRLVPASGPEIMVALSRLVSIGIGPITVAFIALKLSPVEQGYYFTFGSITGAMVLFELGIGYVLTQITSHEATGLRVTRKEISGSDDAVSRIGSILRFGVSWHLIMAAIFLVSVGVGGFFYMSLQSQPFAGRQGPWFLLISVTALGLMTNPVWATFEGCNLISVIYRIRLIRALITASFLWLFLWLGTGLWANGISDGFGVLFDFLLVFWYRRPLVAFAWRMVGPKLRWREEIWPFQWRISVSWASGYVTFALFTPIAFRLFGPEVAGRVGLSLALLNAIGGVAWSFMQANAPTFGNLVARRDWSGFERLFIRKALLATAAFFALCLAATVCLAALDLIGIPILHRLLTGPPLIVFALGALVVQLSGFQGAYLRAYKQEPLFWLSPLTGAFVLALSLALGSIYGPIGMAVSYFATYGLVALPVGSYILARCRRKWQGGVAGPNGAPLLALDEPK